MANIYVRTDGNDSTGNGSTGTPYLTISKALSVATGGDKIIIGTGAYAESTSGAGYLNITQDFTSQVTIVPESGVLGSVSIVGTGTAWSTIIADASNIHFDSIIFDTQASTVTAAMRFTTALTNIAFTRCKFLSWGNSGSTGCVTTAWTVNSQTISGLAFRSCEFAQKYYSYGFGIQLVNAGSGSTASVVIDNCKVDVGYYACRLHGLTDVSIFNNEFLTWSPDVVGTAFSLGEDNTTGALCSGSVIGNKMHSVRGHGCVIGAGSNGVLLAHNRIKGGESSNGGQGCVIKQCSNVRAEYNSIQAGYSSGLYFKAAQDCQAFFNTIRQNKAASSALRIGYDSANSAKCARITARRNFIWANAGKAIEWNGDSEDDGGGWCDENVYHISGSATLGTIRGTTVSDIIAMRSAWSGYDRPVNDANSLTGATAGVFAGTPLIDLPT